MKRYRYLCFVGFRYIYSYNLGSLSCWESVLLTDSAVVSLAETFSRWALLHQSLKL